ncbi:unnamed protein product [Caenorhabditis brenneri]
MFATIRSALILKNGNCGLTPENEVSIYTIGRMINSWIDRCVTGETCELVVRIAFWNHVFAFEAFFSWMNGLSATIQSARSLEDRSCI